jgi:ubiquitin C-terminal hydrolase
MNSYKMVRLDGTEHIYSVKNQEKIQNAKVLYDIDNINDHVTVIQGSSIYSILFMDSGNIDGVSKLIQTRIPPAIELPGACLFRNVGNSCYINSCIQLLYAIPEMRDFFNTITTAEIETLIPNQFGEGVHDYIMGYESCKPEDINKNKELLKILKELFNTMDRVIADKSDNYKHILIDKKSKTSDPKLIDIPTTIINIYEKLFKVINTNVLPVYQLRIRSSEDAPQFFRALIRPFECFAISGSRVRNLLNTFILQTMNRLTCNDNRTTDRYIRESLLKIDINTIEGANISDYLNNYLMEKNISGDRRLINFCTMRDVTAYELASDTGSYYRDPMPDNIVKLEKKNLMLDENFTTLIIQLERLTLDMRTGDQIKISKRIIPDRILTVNSIDEDTPIRFIRQGVVIHIGNGRAGHYIYGRFDRDGNNMDMLNDSKRALFTDRYTIDKRTGNPLTYEDMMLTGGTIFYYRRI